MNRKVTEVTVRNVTIKIYSRVTAKGYEEHRFRFYNEEGKRKIRVFGTLADAEAEAKLVAEKIAGHQVSVLDLTPRDRLEFQRAREALAPFNTPIDTAALQYAQLRSLLGEVLPVEAARFFLRHHRPDRPCRTVRQTYEELLKAKRADGVSEVYLRDLRNRCGRFANAFSCNIADVSAPEISEYLRSLKAGSRTRNNVRESILTLFTFAERSGYIEKGSVDAYAVPKAKVIQHEPEIFTPDQLEALLKAAEPEFLPLLVLGAFAGIRCSEVQRLDWSAFDLEQNVIFLRPSKTKTNRRRVVPIQPNLRSWLLPLAKSSGRVFNYANYQKPLERAAAQSEVDWKKNALRHSYISYRLAITQNKHQVAEECGNSPEKIDSNYKALVKPADAQRWFSIVPDQPKKVIELKRAA